MKNIGKYTILTAFFCAALFLGGRVLYGADISGSLTIASTTRKAGSPTTHDITFTTSGSGAGDEIVIDFSAYGTGALNGFDLSGATLVGTFFSGFTTDPTGISVNNTAAKTVTFTGASFGNGASLAIISLDVTNPTTTSTGNSITITTKLVGGNVDTGSEPHVIDPGSLNYFTITGEPASTTAGQDLTSVGGAGNITVSAYDEYDNVKTDYVGTVTFTSTDGGGGVVLPANYLFTGTGGDDGTHDFNRTAFTLATAGNQTISAADTVQTGIKATTAAIDVVADGIASFTLNAPASVTAGVPFSLSVSGAVDGEGNAASGTIDVAFTDAPATHLAPDGTNPALASITVSGGSGSANQTLVLAESLTGGVDALTGTDSVTAATDDSGNITVLPGSLNYFTITGEPASIAAGAPFSNITVTAYDEYDNVKTNYLGTVQFSTTDPNTFETAMLNGFILPAGTQTNAGTQYPFDGGDSGTHTFVTNFELETPGNQTISVFDTVKTSVKATTDPIDVLSGDIASFDLVDPGTVTAGVPFTLSVINVQDALGRAADGTITITWQSGDSGTGTAPDGSDPSFAQIVVSNGSGSATQILTKADTNVVLRGTGSTGGTDDTDTFTVQPGTLDGFNITADDGGNIGTEAAGQFFSIDITAQDVHGNTLDSGANLFSGTADLSLNNGETVTTPSTAFTAGVLDDFSVTITKADTDVRLRAVNSGGTYGTDPDGVSNNFEVQPGPADSFDITTTIADPQTAGEGFTVRIEALDGYGNVLSFGDNEYEEDEAELTDIGGDGAAVVPSTLTFENGVWESTVTITKANTGTNTVQLQVVDETGGVELDAGTSNTFTVIPGPLDHFTFTTNPEEVEAANSPIPIVVEGRDRYENLVTGYSGTATVSDSTGSVYEDPTPGDTSLAFAGGTYSGAVVITTTRDGVVITVQDGDVVGSSTPFFVIGNELAFSLEEDLAPKVALTGSTVEMYDITLYNLHPTDDALLSSMDFFVQSSRNSQYFVSVPSTLIDAMTITDLSTGTVHTTTSVPSSNSAVTVDFDEALSVPAETTVTIRVSVTVRADVSAALVPNIRLEFADVEGTRTGEPVTPVNDYTDFIPVNDPENYPDYLIRSSLTNIRTTLNEAAYNYPNPFNPRNQTTSIVYYSPAASATTIKIFTITGRLVRRLTHTAVSGSNEVSWDGKNGKGQVVRNGVYVAVIMTSGGGKQVVKIAVVK